MINLTYLLPLLLLAMVIGWLDKFELKKVPDGLMNLCIIPVLCLLISLIINWVKVGFLSTLCYFGIAFVVYVLNLFIVAPSLDKIKNHDLFFCIGLLIAFAICFWLFYVQFS